MTGHYAPVNGMNLYYELHGDPAAGRPLVLLHGAFSAIGTSFGPLLPALSAGRPVIGVELQGHGRTADIDRPLTIGALADDVAALLEHLDLDAVDVFGYSVGAAVAFELALRRPDLVRRLVLASFSSRLDGLYPGLLDGIAELRPEHLVGSPFEREYVALAPQPGDFPVLVEKVKMLDANLPEWSDEQLRSVRVPVQLIVGDSDIIRPEHAVEVFRLLGGGVVGDNVGLPDAQLAVVPGATHITLMHQVDVLSAIVPAFLDRVPAASLAA